jgi:hypothetical protein
MTGTVATRDDQIDVARLRGELGELPAPASSDERHAAGRQPRRDRRLGGDEGEHRVGVGRRGGAAQDDRVARLQAQGGGVDGDVGTRLVHHRDHPEGDADLAYVQAVGQAVAVDDLADGIGEGGDLAHCARDRLHAILIKEKTVEERLAYVTFAPGEHVALVGREDLVQAFAERRGDGLQGGVLDGGVGPRERACRALGLGARVRDG